MDSLSLSLSVFPSWTCQELLPLTKVISMLRTRSKVRITGIKTQFSSFRTVTPIWIHIWRWNDAQSLMCIGEVPYCFSCDHAALWIVQSVCHSVRQSLGLSVCLSLRPSVRPPVCLSHLFNYVPIIVPSWQFHELSQLAEVMSMQKVEVRGQRSRSQR